jgi:hypothetical protein
MANVSSAYPIFSDIDGQPLEAGYIWIGQANLDPVTNQTNVFWDEAFTQPVVQPIRTRGGYPLNGSSIGRLYTTPNFSLRVTNKTGSALYDDPDVYLPPTTNTVSVLDFGAVGDGVTDDRAAFQKTIDAIANASVPSSLYVPAGRYRIIGNLRIKSSISMYGDGIDTSALVFDDTTPTSRLLGTDVTGAYNIIFDSLSFESKWGNGNDWSEGSQLVYLQTTGNVNVFNCGFNKAAKMSLIVQSANNVNVTNCLFDTGNSDGCRLIDVGFAVVSNNTFKRICDDAVAIHTTNSLPSPVDRAATISGNLFVDSQGICVLGIKDTTITGNTLLRTKTRAIFVGSFVTDTTEGNTAAVAVTITGNVIDTLFDRFVLTGAGGSGDHYITVTSIVPTTNGSGYVGQPDGSGGIVSPFAYFRTNAVNTNPPAPGSWVVSVADNVCVRSYEPTTNYSDYGVGLFFGKSGPVDPAVPAGAFFGIGSTLRSQIYVINNGQNISISNNVLWGGGQGIWLDGTTGSAYLSWQDVLIIGNSISNFIQRGIYVEGEGGAVSIKSNLIDGDPLHTNPERLPNGKWSSNWNLCSSIHFAGNSAKGIIQGNDFRNVGVVFRGASEDNHTWLNNVMACNPVSTGYQANNIGIGNISRPLRLGSVVLVEDGDPASATYGQVLNSCVTSSTVLPSTGKYVEGHFVQKSDPIVAGSGGSQYIVYGWIRMTTGTGHVLNTDWCETRTLTGT